MGKYEGYSANIIKSFPTLQRDHTSELLKLNTPRIDYKKRVEQIRALEIVIDKDSPIGA